MMVFDQMPGTIPGGNAGDRSGIGWGLPSHWRACVRAIDLISFGEQSST